MVRILLTTKDTKGTKKNLGRITGLTGFNFAIHAHAGNARDGNGVGMAPGN